MREHPFTFVELKIMFVCFSLSLIFLITHVTHTCTQTHTHAHKHTVWCLYILRPEQFPCAGLLFPVQLTVGVF